MTMLNIIGITRFIDLGFFTVAVGVLPYPITFLVTDLISELYGQRRANFLVTVGLVLNFFILGVLTLGIYIPPVSQPLGRLAGLELSSDVILRTARPWVAKGTVLPVRDDFWCRLCFDDGPYRRPVGSKTVPFLEATHKRQASLVAQQRQYHCQSDGGFLCCDIRDVWRRLYGRHHFTRRDVELHVEQLPVQTDGCNIGHATDLCGRALSETLSRANGRRGAGAHP